MGRILKVGLICGLVIASNIAAADGHELPEPKPVSDVWESEAERQVTLTTTYIVGAVLLAFLLTNKINDTTRD